MGTCSTCIWPSYIYTFLLLLWWAIWATRSITELDANWADWTILLADEDESCPCGFAGLGWSCQLSNWPVHLSSIPMSSDPLFWRCFQNVVFTVDSHDNLNCIPITLTLGETTWPTILSGRALDVIGLWRHNRHTTTKARRSITTSQSLNSSLVWKIPQIWEKITKNMLLLSLDFAFRYQVENPFQWFRKTRRRKAQATTSHSREKSKTTMMEWGFGGFSCSV